MKPRIVFSILSHSLLVLLLITVFLPGLAAQDTTEEPASMDKLVSKHTTPEGPDFESSDPLPAEEMASADSMPDKTIAPELYDPDYWFDKGALCATYGNDRAAIKYFQKAISLDPSRSGAYFEQGISYGQLGEYDKALLSLNKALEMEPNNGLYLYGRGRVHLLAGNKNKATKDFKRAAELNDEDAQNYLDMIANTISEMKE